MQYLIPDIGGVIAFLVVAPFVATLVGMALFSKSEPIPVREWDDSQRVYIRCNDWEFIPATVADLEHGDTFVLPSFYLAMQAMESRRP